MSLVSVPQERIERKIFLIRGIKVMLDSDLAKLYGVATKVLNQAVKRNKERFPQDFMFILNTEEAAILRSQNVTSKESGRGGRQYLPYVFSEQGIAMLSSVLHSRRAIQVNIAIMRAFVKLRELISTHKDLEKKIGDLERKYKDHDEKIVMIFEAIHRLLTPPPDPAKKRIGFHSD